MTETTDDHLQELMTQCATNTPLGRLAGVEQRVVFRWLLDGGYMARTGKAMTRPRPHPHPIGSRSDGSPIYAPGADFTTHETIEMPATAGDV